MEARINEFLHWLEFEKGRQPNTIQAYRFELKRFVQALHPQGLSAWEEVDKARVREFLFSLTPTNEKAARGRTLSAIRSFFQFLVREGYLATNPTEGIETPQLDRKVPSYLTREEYLHLLETVQEYATPNCRARDLAIVALFLGTGIRRGELVGLDLADVDLQRQTVRVVRKGGNEQFVEFGSDVKDRLEDYLQQRGKKFGPFFLSERDTRLSGGGVYQLVKKYLFFADLPGAVHSLRHTCFTELARQGVNLPVIQAIAGHRRAETTARYTHTQEADRRRAVELIKLT
jgi:integrase/recombinase XerC